MMELKGTKIYLRQIHQGDMPQIHQAHEDEELRYLTHTKESYTLKEMTKRYKQLRKDVTREDFSICVTESNQLIGDLTLFAIDLESKKARFRLTLHDKNYQNKGYGTEVVTLVQDFVFKELKLNRLEVEVLSHNSQGIHLFAQTGFKQEGVLRQFVYLNHQYSDNILMAMIRVDYHQARRVPYEMMSI